MHFGKCSKTRIVVKTHYRWVPVNPNLDNPNSQIIWSAKEIILLSLLICKFKIGFVLCVVSNEVTLSLAASFIQNWVCLKRILLGITFWINWDPPVFGVDRDPKMDTKEGSLRKLFQLQMPTQPWVLKEQWQKNDNALHQQQTAWMFWMNDDRKMTTLQRDKETFAQGAAQEAVSLHFVFVVGSGKHNDGRSFSASCRLFLLHDGTRWHQSWEVNRNRYQYLTVNCKTASEDADPGFRSRGRSRPSSPVSYSE